MANTKAVPIDELIYAAGMTCFAEDCDVIVMRVSPRMAAQPPEVASEVVPPFAG